MAKKAPFQKSLSQFFSSKTDLPQGNRQSLSLAVEKLEDRVMLNGDTQALIFQAGFEDANVSRGGFLAVQEVSGFTATGNAVEVQNNPGGVGPASEGRNHLELDGVNGVFVDLTPSNNQDLVLKFDYSARPKVSKTQNAIQVWWKGELIQTVSDDGRNIRTTKFREIQTTLSGTTGPGRLEFRSQSPNDRLGLGGLLDDVRVFENIPQAPPLELAAIADQEVVAQQTLTVDADLLPPNDTLEGAVFSIVDGPVGLQIDPTTGVVTWPASQANIDASNIDNNTTTFGNRSLVFRSGFEDAKVATGGFGFFKTVSGFTSTNGDVEVQDNHPSVGRASEGRQILELDGRNGIFRNVATSAGDQLELLLDYSPRPGVDAVANEIEILWDGKVIDSITRDGSRLSGTSFRQASFDLSDFTGDLTRLEFRSKVAGSNLGLGGLLDNIRLFRRRAIFNSGTDGKYDVTVLVTGADGQTDTESFTICLLESHTPSAPTIAPIETQQVDELASLSVTATATDADLPNDTLTWSVTDGPDGLEIDPTTGEITWTPTEAQGPGQFSSHDRRR